MTWCQLFGVSEPQLPSLENGGTCFIWWGRLPRTPGINRGSACASSIGKAMLSTRDGFQVPMAGTKHNRTLRFWTSVPAPSQHFCPQIQQRLHLNQKGSGLVWGRTQAIREKRSLQDGWSQCREVPKSEQRKKGFVGSQREGRGVGGWSLTLPSLPAGGNGVCPPPASFRGGPAAGAAAISQHYPISTTPPPSPPGYKHPSCFGCTIKGACLRFIAGLCLQGVTNASLWTLCGP